MRRGLVYARLIGHHHANFVDAAAGNVHAAVRRGHHVADYTAAGRNRRGGERLRFGIEAHDCILRENAGLAIPNHSVRSNRYSIGARLRPSRRRPEFHFARSRVEAAQTALLIIEEIDGVILGDGDAARPSPTTHQLDFGDLHGLRVDLGQFVGAKFAENRNTLARYHHAVAPSVSLRTPLTATPPVL